MVWRVHAFDRILFSAITESFKNVDIFSFRPVFADSFRSSMHNLFEHTANRATQLLHSGTGHRVGPVPERKPDKETFVVISKLVNEVGVGKENPYRALRQVRVSMNNKETVNSILYSAIGAQTSITVVINNNYKNVALMCDAPAECINIGEWLKRRMFKRDDDEVARKDKKKRAGADAARETSAEIRC